MRARTAFAIVGAAIAAIALGGVAPVAAQKAAKGGGNCVNKAASGTNTTQDGAKFQAWEAVLQATDWGSWSAFMASGKSIGNAPGYSVSNVKASCAKGGLGYNCKMQATLCK